MDGIVGIRRLEEPLGWPASGSELGPIPFYHQVYLDLRGDRPRRVWPRPPRPAGARAGAPVRRQPHHRPARARRARARAAPRAHAAAAARSSCRRASTATSTSRTFTEEMQRRGLDPETRLIAARPEPAGERRAAARAGARLADALPGAAAPRRRRPAAARAGVSAGGTFPGLLATDLEHVALPAAHRPLRHRVPRPARRSSRSCSRARRACSA